MIEIKPFKITKSEVNVPGSKSYTHRLLIAASLSDGVCMIKNPLKSEDTSYTMDGIKSLGVSIEQKEDLFIIHGAKGDLKPCSNTIFLGNSGTSMRLLTGLAAIGKGKYELAGTKRMHERPVKDLLDALNALGVTAYSKHNNGCPPVIVYGGLLKGGNVKIRCNVSSQYLSSLLLIAPLAENGMTIEVCDGLVSRPYVDMTVDIMTKMGIKLNRSGYESFFIEGKQTYKSGEYFVEPDCSQACYFWAAAAITGAKIKVKNIARNTSQGDLRFTEILKKMGCNIEFETDGVSVAGGKLHAVEADMADMPDIVPTLSVVAAFAQGTTVIKNAAHLKAKETDRLNATANELKKIGIEVVEKDDGLIIVGGKPLGAQIDTYNDHRMAMSFALAGLRIPGVFIKDEKCVEKSFPNFWEVFFKL